MTHSELKILTSELKHSPTIFECKRLSILLIEGSARTRLYLETILEFITPHIIKPSKSMFFMILCYSDYPPVSQHVVETIFVGEDHAAAIEALRTWSFTGGAPIRNALHEGIAAAIEVCLYQSLHFTSCETWQYISLSIISTTFIYEQFYTHVQVRKCKRYARKTTEELLRELQQRRIILYYFCPSEEMGRAFTSLLERVYSEKELKTPTSGIPLGWAARIIVPEGQVISRSNSSGENSDVMAIGEATPTTTTANNAQNALETAVKQFLAAVIKLPQNKRADAIKQQIESPTYSAEYKQCLIAMVKQLQNQAKVVNTGLPTAPVTRTLAMTSQSSVGSTTRLAPNVSRPTTAPSVPNTGRTSIWHGRLAFRHSHLESYFDVAACPIPNPKSNMPQLVPAATDYHIDSWPLVLAISSFVAVQSPAVMNSVPISKLVDLIAWAKDSATAAANSDIANGFRNLLISRQLVGLVRLGGNHAMLIAARPHQLVGMILSKQDAAPQLSRVNEPSSTMYNVPSSSMTSHDISAFSRSTPPAYVSTSMNYQGRENLTPEAILRQHRPGTTSLPSLPISSTRTEQMDTADVFNALVTSQSMDLDAMKQGDPMLDVTDFSLSYSPIKQSSNNDNFFTDF